MLARDALVVGYGSIGRRHVRALASAGVPPAIVDVDAAARAAAAAEHPAARVAAGLAELDAVGFPWAEAAAVIATWGPSHAPLFHALADRGVRRVLCEKPLAVSVAQAAKMLRRAHHDGIALSVNHHLRYAGLARALEAAAAEHELGAPVGLVVEGGAACLVTNGIHWLDLAIDAFGAAPRRVAATGAGEPINPRSPDLRFYGGTAIWIFDDGREAVVTFTNRSSVALRAHLRYRHGVAEIDGDLNVSVRRRDPDAVRRWPAVTRTGPADRCLVAGRLQGVLSFEEHMRAAADALLAGDVATSPGAVGALAVAGCVGALVAAREGRAVDLPIDADGPWGREAWPIS
jgi:predicted dehydrogenase